MISFTINEILTSVLLSVIYGAIAAVLGHLFGSIIIFVKSFARLADDVLLYEGKLIARVKADYQKHNSGFSLLYDWISVFLGIVAYTLGYIVLSYYLLDGVLRLYVLILSVSSFFVLRKLLHRAFNKLTVVISLLLYGATVISLRFLAFPIRFIVNRLISKQTTSDTRNSDKKS